MPRISQFNGIIITMYFQDHVPPHFHAEYGGREALIAFNPTVQVHGGGLPRRQQQLVLDWAMRHKEELLDNWRLAQIPTTLNWISYP